MRAPARLLALAWLPLGLACTSPSPPEGVRGAGRRPADKAALYGDASLVPTRAGERIRTETALAREIEQAVAVLPSVARVRVDVELPDAMPRPGARPHPPAEPRVIAVVAGAAPHDDASTPARIEAIARAVVGPRAAVEVIVEGSAPPAPAPPPARWPLLLCVLGLGFFVGVLVERTRRIVHARALGHRAGAARARR